MEETKGSNFAFGESGRCAWGGHVDHKTLEPFFVSGESGGVGLTLMSQYL